MHGPRNASTGVDPTEFSTPPLADPAPRENSDVPANMLALVAYGNGAQASPIGIATFTFRCQGFRTKLTCPVFDLADELDVVLGHDWCYAHQAVISYKDEQVTYVYKDRSHLLKFDDPTLNHALPHLPSIPFVRWLALFRSKCVPSWLWFVRLLNS